MRVVALCLSFVLSACLGVQAVASDPAKAAFTSVLTNAARHGVEAAEASYNAGTSTIEPLLFAQDRLLRAEAGKIETDGFPKSAADANLARITRLRERVNVNSETTASQVDFDYQLARAIAAQADRKLATRWQADIVALAELQGTWQEIRSKRVGSGERETVTLQIVGGVSRFRWNGSSIDGWITLDPTRTPKQIACWGLNVDHWPNTIGVYELSGNELRLSCRLGQGERNRPAGFAADEGQDHVVYTLRRSSDKRAARY